MKAKTQIITKVKAGFLITALLCSLGLRAQNLAKPAPVQDQIVNENPKVKLTRYEVKPEHQKAFRKAISNYVNFSLKQKGNILSEAFYEQEKPDVLWIIERWDSQTLLNRIEKSENFKVIQSLSAKALIQPAKVIYVKDLEPISKQQWRTAANKTDTPITIMLFVDSKAGTDDDFKRVYHTAMPQFRSEPGVINYQLSQFEDDSTQFVTYEKFRNEDAFQYHLNFKPIQPVIDYLNTSIKQQPFQKGIHRLIAFTASGDN
ncbi:putative quinol monooxygenase [Mucilaginibacter celer]|uniref:Antibiotic biosynthesis monooxygenase n=1 Tax=Mucilaginibacter celer TaxID=2305508 RepID=A0A494VKU0_9SPHI|nr:antibiotic biosynthesis monooxygenase family protein [Mucilaginibacter celer]AYL95797.1 antibiotic biosynthesis monooxygenase [Mucilaginibacter celer]